MGDRRCVCGHLEVDHADDGITVCTVRDPDGLYADFCLLFTEPLLAEIKALAEYPLPNKRPCPQCAGTMNLFSENSETDLWWCVDHGDYVELPTLRKQS